MIKLKTKKQSYEYEQLLQDLIKLLKKDPDDRLAAGYVCLLLQEGEISFGMARELYKEAIGAVYFS